jgi:hypothetical protein
VAGLAANPVGAAAPDQQGWWTTLNQGSAPELGKPISAPTPPDVPAKGLLVEGPSTSTSPVAYAGLVYYLPLGATASTLTLTIAAKSATTPNATLELCPLVNPVLNPEQGGPIADAPPYDCSHSVKAAPNSAGSAYEFKISPFVANGSLAVAILPTSPTDRVVFDQPDANSLDSPTSPAGSSEQSPSLGVTSTAADGGAPIPASIPLLSLGATAFGLTPEPALSGAPATSGGAAPAAPVPAAAAPRSSSALPTLGVLSDDRANPLTVALVLAGFSGGAALWFLTGRRRPDEPHVAVGD